MHWHTSYRSQVMALAGAQMTGWPTRSARCGVSRGHVARVATANHALQLELYDVPVSPAGARVRHVIYTKGLEGAIHVQPPAVLGGLKSQQYLALNPQGKMPLLVVPGGPVLPESEVIVQYLLDTHGMGPRMVAATPEARARAALLTRVHDIYLWPVMGCMYKKMDAAQRAEQLSQLAYQLDVLEGIMDPVGPYAAGAQLTTADSALFPSFVFLTFMLPKFFGWASVFNGRPRLEVWWQQIQEDLAAARVIEELRGGLRGWEENDRWRQLGILEQVQDPTYTWSY